MLTADCIDLVLSLTGTVFVGAFLSRFIKESANTFVVWGGI